MGLQNLVLEANEVISSEFGFVPEKTTYQVHNQDEWNNFLKRFGSNLNAQGIFLPRNLSAHMLESSFLPVYLFHEFFGHGLFCEHSLIGQNIVSLEQSLEIVEKEIFGTLNDHQQIDETHPFFHQYNSQRESLQTFLSLNHANYEGFAIWMEHFLSLELGHQDIFNKKFDTLHPDYKNLFEHFHNLENNYGTFILMSSLGFPKTYDGDLVLETLRKLSGDDYDLVILYGSRKSYSDIDLFVVSDSVKSGFNGWFDVYAVTPDEFEEGIVNLSIAVTDPLFSGEVLFGCDHRGRVFNQSITEDAIQYNFRQSDEQKKFALLHPEYSRERILGLSYHDSFRMNAEALRKGLKLLTLSALYQ